MWILLTTMTHCYCSQNIFVVPPLLLSCSKETLSPLVNCHGQDIVPLSFSTGFGWSRSLNFVFGHFQETPHMMTHWITVVLPLVLSGPFIFVGNFCYTDSGSHSASSHALRSGVLFKLKTPSMAELSAFLTQIEIKNFKVVWIQYLNRICVKDRRVRCYGSLQFIQY